MTVTPIKTDRLYVYAGSQLREVREKAGLSPDALGKVVDTTGQSIRNYEAGQPPSAAMLAKFASFFGVSPDHFFLSRTLAGE